MNSALSSQCLLRSLLTDAEDAIVCFQLDGSLVLWNAAAEKLYGYAAEEVIGKNVSLTLPLYEVPAVANLLRHPGAVSNPVTETVERLGKLGARLSLRITRSVIRDEEGSPIAIMERASNCCLGLKEVSAEAHLRLLMDQMPVVFWTADLRLRITSHWGSGFRGVRAFRGNSPGQTVHEYLRCPRGQEAPVKQHLDALNGVSSRFEYRRGKRVFEISIQPMRNSLDTVVGCIGMALDITERKRTEEEIRFQATHDGLTGLANYREFVSHLEDEVLRVSRSGRPFGLLLLDLDGLKIINDRYGHLVGNRALKQLACLMKDHSRATDIAARYGGDEFGLLLIDADYQRSEQVAARIRDCLSRESGSPRLTVSIGVSVYPEDGHTAQELLEIADRRLYQDKKASSALLQAVAAE